MTLGHDFFEQISHAHGFSATFNTPQGSISDEQFERSSEDSSCRDDSLTGLALNGKERPILLAGQSLHLCSGVKLLVRITHTYMRIYIQSKTLLHIFSNNAGIQVSIGS